MICPVRCVALLAVFPMLASQSTAEHPIGWTAALGRLRGEMEEYGVHVDRNVKHTGEASCCIKSEVPDPKGAGTVTQAFKADKYAKKRLRMTAFSKTDQVKDGAALFLAAQGEKRGNLAADYMLTRRVKGTNDWTRYALVLDIPEEATIIAFGASLGGKGKVWVDDFNFDVVGKEI